MDLNIQDNDGNTPLHTACKNGNIDIAKALLIAGKVSLPGVKSYCTLRIYIYRQHFDELFEEFSAFLRNKKID